MSMRRPRRARPVSTAPLDVVVASRRLQVAGRGRRFLLVRFEKPRRWGRDWTCRFEMRGLGKRTVHRAFGVDSLQALALALEIARIYIVTSGVRIAGTWVDELGGMPALPLAGTRAAARRVKRAAA